MKNRRNIFKKLEETVPIELYQLVKELFNEVKDYYMKMDYFMASSKIIVQSISILEMYIKIS